MSLKFAFTNLINTHGFYAEIHRPGTNYDVTVKVVRRYMEAIEVAMEVDEESLSFKVNHDSLLDAGFPVPMKRGDKIKELIFNRTYTARTVEPHIVHGSCIGYTIRCGTE